MSAGDAAEARLRTDSVEAALRALRHRDLSEAALERWLADRGFAESERAQALATLRRTGLLDDRRFAESRATTLAGRGSGDTFIRHDLKQAGVASELIEDAVGSLESEPARASRVVERRGHGPKTIRYLRGKGFSDETIASVVGAAVDAAGVIASGSRDELG